MDLNILKTDVTWSSANCVATETGDNTSLNARKISTTRLSDRELMCLDDISAKVPQLLRAGAYEDEITFSEALIELKVKQNAKQLAKLAFQGSITGGTGNLALADGYLEIAKGESGDLAHYATTTGSTLSTIIDDVRVALNNRTDEMFENATTIYMGVANASLLSQALVDANLFNFGQVKEDELGYLSFMFPGTNVKVVGTPGMAGGFFMTVDGNLRYGCDLENDAESVEVFFDKYHKQLVSDIVFSIGFQYHEPAQVIFIEKI
ncbi:MAG: hypothetical protein GY870_06760 [archaeon]|nr:hypothetical protein [archaeon]